MLCLLAFTVPDETSPINHIGIGISLYVMSQFSLTAFMIFFLSLTFNIWLLCVWVWNSVYPTWHLLRFFDVQFFIKFRHFHPSLSILSSDPFPSSGTTIMHMLVCLMVSYMSPVLFYFIFSVVQTASTPIFKFTMLSSANSNVLFSSFKFLMLVNVLLNSRIFKIIFISLLMFLFLLHHHLDSF